jgi:hypothetical protein
MWRNAKHEVAARTVDAGVRPLISVNGPFKGHQGAVKGVSGAKTTIFLLHRQIP